jgi:hypothetical protein
MASGDFSGRETYGLPTFEAKVGDQKQTKAAIPLV